MALKYKGDRPKGTFYGNDEGVWRYTEGYPMGLRREGWNWSASIGLSSKNDWKNLSVDGASEQNRGFRKALREIVREYPEVAGYLISFDGPYMPVSSLVGGAAPEPESRIDLGKQTYYHGTSSDVLDAILSDGLKPRGQTNVEPVFGVEFGARPSRAEAVYLTTQLGLAQSAANSAARKRRGDPVILEVTGLHHDHFQPDEDSRESDAVKSLERMGSVAYVGRIRPRNIRVYAMDDGSGWNKWASATRVASRYAATTPLPPSFPKTEIGLMTMDEFLEYRNPQGKFHEAETWDYDVMRMNRPMESYLGSWRTGRPGAPDYSFSGMRNGVKVTKKPDILAGVIHNGTLYFSNARDGRDIPDYFFKNGVEGSVEIRKRKQVKYLSEVLPLISPVAKQNVREYPVILQRLIVKGEPMTLRSEGSTPGSTLAILNSEDLRVAQASDEWGATLIAVAREYRGRGLGKIIGKRWYELNPSNTSGGFTSAGQENALALWRDRVREFKARGWYSEMIREGRITMDKLRDIFKGVEDSKRDLEEFKELYFSEREPEPTKPTGDILVWSDGDTGVIVYDRAFLEDPDDRFIHGYGFLRSTPQTGTYIFSIDYDRPYADMTTKALMQAARDGGDDRLYDGDGYSDIVEAENIPGVERDGDYLVLTRDLFPLRQEARKEKRLRKSVDPYDEKFYLLQEQADSKWR